MSRHAETPSVGEVSRIQLCGNVFKNKAGYNRCGIPRLVLDEIQENGDEHDRGESDGDKLARVGLDRLMEARTKPNMSEGRDNRGIGKRKEGQEGDTDRDKPTKRARSKYLVLGDDWKLGTGNGDRNQGD